MGKQLKKQLFLFQNKSGINDIDEELSKRYLSTVHKSLRLVALYR